MLKHKAFIYIATVLGLAFFVYDKASAATELYYEWGPWGAGPFDILKEDVEWIVKHL